VVADADSATRASRSCWPTTKDQFAPGIFGQRSGEGELGSNPTPATIIIAPAQRRGFPVQRRPAPGRWRKPESRVSSVVDVGFTPVGLLTCWGAATDPI